MFTRNRFCDIDCSVRTLPPIYDFRSQKLVSFEEALKPIESQIEQLSSYVNIAKEHCHYPSEHNLTRDESGSIYIYTMEWGEQSLHRILNQALRNENRQALKIWFPYLKLFDCALDKLPTVRENLWRGIPEDIGKKFIKNQVLTWWSVNSCSSSVDVIKRFIGNSPISTLFLIEAMNGKNISNYTALPKEEEVILKMGTQLRVQNDASDHPNGSFIVHLIETDDEEDSLARATNQISLTTIKRKQTKPKLKFQQYGKIVAGGNGKGSRVNQFYYPYGIFVDENKTIFVADYLNDRIVKWKCDGKQGQIVAGGNGQGNRIDQLDRPTDVIVDQQNHSLIIADQGNRRVIRWSRDQKQQILIENIGSYGLTMDPYGYLYVSDYEKNEVKKWNLENINENKEGILVAGGNGQGNQLNQLNRPSFIFVNKDQSLYVSDHWNHRVMKWRKDAKKGIVVAGGNGKGNNLNQLICPQGLFVDECNTIYVVDHGNHRIMRWCEGGEEGSIGVGGSCYGSAWFCPQDLSFDLEGNLYVTDSKNDRIQKFEIDVNYDSTQLSEIAKDIDGQLNIYKQEKSSLLELSLNIQEAAMIPTPSELKNYQFVVIDIKKQLSPRSDAMFKLLLSMSKNSIIIEDNSFDIDSIKTSKKIMFLITSNEFFTNLKSPTKHFKAIFILDDDKNKTDNRERFSSSEHLIFRLVDELYRCYKIEAKEDEKNGNIFVARIKEEIADKLYDELKKAYRSVPTNMTTTTSLIDTTIILIWFTSEDNCNEVKQLQDLLINIISQFHSFYNIDDFLNYQTNNKIFGNIFLIQDTKYEDRIIENLQESLNIKTIYHYGQTSSKYKTIIDNYNDLCFELISDLASYYKKLGSVCSSVKDTKKAQEMFDKAAQLYKTLHKF